MSEKSSIPRLVGSIISTAIVVSLGWLLVYHYAIKSLIARGAGITEILLSVNLSSAAWWRDFIAVAFDVLILIIAFFGTWWVLGHLALEAAEAGKWRKYYKSAEAKDDVWVERLSLWQRIQHIWIMLTFIACAYTGLALNLKLYTTRADFLVIHVYSGFAMGVLVIIHFLQYLIDAILSKAAGQSLRRKYPMLEFYSLRFVRNFFKALVRTISSKVKPDPYGKYDPEQLFEYWGVYWGMVVLGIPGVIMALYGPNVLEGLLWVMHTKEAILAIMFILVVHMGYTHLRPKVFPMDSTYLSGKMPMKRIKEEHPLWAEELLRRGKNKEKALAVIR